MMYMDDRGLPPPGPDDQEFSALLKEMKAEFHGYEKDEPA